MSNVEDALIDKIVELRDENNDLRNEIRNLRIISELREHLPNRINKMYFGKDQIILYMKTK